jgi:hypothetical protein
VDILNPTVNFCKNFQKNYKVFEKYADKEINEQCAIINNKE